MFHSSTNVVTVFCMIRVISTVLRLAWIYHQRNIRLAIAAQIFVAAGTVILFVINLFFTQRLMRARHPHIGWHKPFKIFIPPVTVALTITGIIMVIVVVVQSFYTLNPHTLRIDRDVQWGVLSYFTFVAFLPIPVVLVMLVLPRRTHTDTFGSGKFRTKIGILLTSSALLTLGAGFRCGTAFLSPTPTRAPTPWYYSKAAFYCFDFLIEFIVVTLYLVVRVDRRFYIPDHAHGEGEYSGEMIPQRPTSEDKDVFTLSPDGRTLSLVDGRKFSTADKRTFSATELNGAQVQEPPTAHTRDNSFDDTASVQSHSYLSINRKSGKYEMRNGSESSFTPGLPD